MRVNRAAHRLVQISHLLNQIIAAKHSACQNIVMAREILRAALQHYIYSKLDGPLIHRRAEGAVDKRKNLVLVGNLLESLQVEDIQIRIGGRFREYKTRVFPDCFFEDLVISKGDYGAFNSELFEV